MAIRLPPEVEQRLTGLVTAFRDGRRDGLACPSCGSAAVTVEDQSARPYSEWYAIACPDCGFSHTAHVGMGWRPPVVD